MLFHLYAGLRPKISGNYLIECNWAVGYKSGKIGALSWNKSWRGGGGIGKKQSGEVVTIR